MMRREEDIDLVRKAKEGDTVGRVGGGSCGSLPTGPILRNVR